MGPGSGHRDPGLGGGVESEEGVRQGEREGPAEGTRLEKVEPEEGAWPLQGEGLAEKARPEFAFAQGP